MMIMFAMEEKTEKATPKRRKDAREEGRVVKSNDINTAFILMGMFGVLKFTGGYCIRRLKFILEKYLTDFNTQEPLNIRNISALFLDLSASFFIVLAPILGASLILSLLINYLQVGFLYTTKTLQPKLSNLNPVEGFRRILSIRSIVEMAKSIAKFIILAYILYLGIKKNLTAFPMLINSEIEVSLKFVVDLIMDLAFKVGIALIMLAILDYLYKWWEHEKNLRMTKKEVKEEIKQMEGDPNIKSKIKQKQMELGMSRMMADLPKADVVIANPTHYAVAIKYDENLHSAPVVLAKGKDLVALKIKEKAKEHKIEIVENKPLAQALYVTVEVGEQIPQEFYVAVAEILAKIYSIKRGGR